jgi:hypothetical protein
MGRIDWLSLYLTPRQLKNGAGDVILRVRRLPAHGFDCLLEKLSHASMMRA